MSAGLINWSHVYVGLNPDSDDVRVRCDACRVTLLVGELVGMEELFLLASRHQLECHPEWGPKEQAADRMYPPYDPEAGSRLVRERWAMPPAQVKARVDARAAQREWLNGA